MISNIEYFNYLKKFNIENINQVENLRLKILDKLQLKKKNNKCLIFFDHNKSNNLNLIKLINDSLINDRYDFYVKLNHNDSISHYKNFPLTFSVITDDQIINFSDYYFHIVVNASGACEDLYFNGYIPFIYKPIDDINFSPLRSKQSLFFSNEKELTFLLNNQHKNLFLNKNFNIGNNLKLWKDILDA